MAYLDVKILYMEWLVTDERDVVDRLLTESVDTADARTVSLIGRLYRIQAHLDRRLAEMLAPFGLDRGQSDVLGTLARAGKPLAPGQLSVSLMCSTGAMTNRVDRLEKAGLITRSHDLEDRRGIRITLTSRGTKIAEMIGDTRRRAADTLIPGLTTHDQDRLNALLRKLLIAYDQSTFGKDDI